MPAFRYTAIDGAGQPVHGTMDAANEGAVVEALQRQGHIPMRAELAGNSNLLTELFASRLTRRTSLTAQEVAEVTRELSTMLGAGQDLDRALRFIVETASSKRIRNVIDRVRNKVRGGSPLAAAIAQEPESFPRLYVGLVRAGEAGATLGETLAHVATLLERQRSLASSIQSAMLYPALLGLVAIGSIVLLLTEVLPQFVPLFEQSGAPMPASTQFMMAAGNFITEAGPWLIILFAVAFLVVRQALQRPALRERADRTLLRIPLVGGLVRETLAARFCRTLGTLLRNGVPLITALGITKEAIGNLAAASALDKAATSARGGAGLARPLGEAGIFPTRTIHLLRLGEETAQLGEMSLRAAEIHEEHSRLTVQRMVALMVPAITIVMGLAVAGIVGSLLVAMLSLNDLAG